jgi:CheY-like chemotaxis protein
MNKILKAGIVDDDPIVIFGMKLMLKQLGIVQNTEVWNNGQQALDGLKALVAKGESLPEVIFLDLTMPVMDGWDFLEALKETDLPGKEQMKIYVLSSSINPIDRDRALGKKEVNDFIVKPLKETRLKEILSLAS